LVNAMLPSIDQMKAAWDESTTEYDFFIKGFQQGFKDGANQTEARKRDPELNGVLHVLEHFNNKTLGEKK
jgi:hypothetical protein